MIISNIFILHLQSRTRCWRFYACFCMGWSVYLLFHVGVLYKNGWTDRDAIWGRFVYA